MPHKNCFFQDCRSDSRYADAVHMKGVFFVKFPLKDENKAHQWLLASKRSDMARETIGRFTCVCSKHFLDEKGPTDKYPDPIPVGASSAELDKYKHTIKRKEPVLRTDEPVKKPRIALSERYALQDHHYGLCTFVKPRQPTNVTMSNAINSTEEESTGAVLMVATTQTAFNTDNTHNSTDGDTPTSVGEDIMVEDLCRAAKVDASTQTDITLENLQRYSNSQLQDHDKLKRAMIVESVTTDDKSCHFYTGMTVAVLMMIFKFLEPKARNMRYWEGDARHTDESIKGTRRGPARKLSNLEEYIMTLVRLRRGFDVQFLSDIFGVSITRVSRLFSTWINLMYHDLKFLIRWAPKDQILKHLPKSFKNYKKTRAIIDCTELFVQKPSLPSSQRITWSSYKQHNTFKILVAIAPTGAFTFVSRLFTGSISDKKIVLESGFLDVVEPGDDIMADRGFLIRDLLALRGATLNIPPFSHGKQLSSKGTTKTRRIASVRIHVERAIGRLKNFKLLQSKIPLSLKSLMDPIVLVCAVITNLDKRLVT